MTIFVLLAVGGSARAAVVVDPLVSGECADVAGQAGSVSIKGEVCYDGGADTVWYSGSTESKDDVRSVEVVATALCTKRESTLDLKCTISEVDASVVVDDVAHSLPIQASGAEFDGGSLEGAVSVLVGFLSKEADRFAVLGPGDGRFPVITSWNPSRSTSRIPTADEATGRATSPSARVARRGRGSARTPSPSSRSRRSRQRSGPSSRSLRRSVTS